MAIPTGAADRRARALRHLATTLALSLVATLITGVGVAAALPHIDWVDRGSVDVALADGWRLVACEGDAPLLCALRPDGVVGGTIWLGISDVWPHEDTTPAGVAADIDGFLAMLGEDRVASCGAGFTFEPHGPVPADVGGNDGYRYGFTLRDGQGRVNEQVVIHLAFVSGLRVVLNTAFSAADGCPGPDHERQAFAAEDLLLIAPQLDAIAAASQLPSDLDRGLACAAEPTAMRFPDTAGNPHLAAIECTASFGLVAGRTDGTYGPAAPLTRAQFATMLARLLEVGPEPLPAPSSPGFADLQGSVHADAVHRLAAAGIVHGLTPTAFGPDRAVTRGQAAALLVRTYERLQGRSLHDAGVTFPDVGDVHRDAVSRAASAGLVQGRADGSFGPGQPLRRDQAAALLARSLHRLAATSGLGQNSA